MEWVIISVAAKELGMSINGVRSLWVRRDIELRKVQKGKRLCSEVSRESLERYKLLIVQGKRRDNKRRKKSEGTGNKIKNKGYILIHKPMHPRAMCDGYVFEQWIVMEEFLGRYLTKEETVHHKNHIRDDNRIENLVLYANRSEHMKKAHNQLKEVLKDFQWD